MTIDIKNKNKAKMNLKIKVIKAPLVDTKILNRVISERARAVVL